MTDSSKNLPIGISVKYDFISKDRKEELCKYDIECIFKILEFDEVVKLKEKGINIDDKLLVNFLSIAIGALRGMLALKTVGSLLNKFPLPMIDVQILLNNLKIGSPDINQDRLKAAAKK